MKKINYDQEFEVQEGLIYIPDSVLLDRERSLDGGTYKVFYVYCWFDQHKNSEPKIAEIIKLTNLTENTVIRKIRKLEALGYLTETEPKNYIPESLRWEIFERDNYTCQNCGSRRCLTIDHIKPQKHGGTSEKENLRTLCRSCNSKKGTKY